MACPPLPPNPVPPPVNITVSSGLVKVPKVTGTSEAQARSDLAQAGFDVQVVELEDGTVSAGTVLAQSPQAGELLAQGSVVTITVATSRSCTRSRPRKPEWTATRP